MIRMRLALTLTSVSAAGSVRTVRWKLSADLRAGPHRGVRAGIQLRGPGRRQQISGLGGVVPHVVALLPIQLRCRVGALAGMDGHRCLRLEDEALGKDEGVILLVAHPVAGE